MASSRIDRGLLAAGVLAPVTLALIAFVIWPVPGTPAADACDLTRPVSDWLRAIGVITGAMILGLALLIWLRRLAGTGGGVGLLPWEAAVIVGVCVVAAWRQWDPWFLIFAPVGGVAAVAALVMAVGELRVGPSRLLPVALWLDALCLLPSLFVVAVLTDHVALFCF